MEGSDEWLNWPSCRSLPVLVLVFFPRPLSCPPFCFERVCCMMYIRGTIQLSLLLKLPNESAFIRCCDYEIPRLIQKERRTHKIWVLERDWRNAAHFSWGVHRVVIVCFRSDWARAHCASRPPVACGLSIHRDMWTAGGLLGTLK